MSSLSLFTATLILIAGVIDDFRTRKFHNWLFLTCAGIAFAVSIYANGGWDGINHAMLGFVGGLVMFMPLVLLKMIGAGDMKLLAAFGAVAGWSAVFDVAVYSLLWGAVFGVVQVALRGELKSMLRNMATIAGAKIEGAKPRAELDLHRIPFTVAILVGWMTFVTLRGFA